MRRDVLYGEPGEVALLLGNEAIARGAIEAGVRFAAGYPGTPSTEILENLAAAAAEFDIYAEWSTNEKVAFENALGFAISGLRAMVTMKHAGLNWVSDPLSIAVLSGIRGGLVIVTADDPNCHSSANEQDNRFYGWLAETLVLEPSDPQEAKDMAREAFALSEKIQLPVILRSVTRVSHARGDVRLGEVASDGRKAHFERDRERFWLSGARALQRHRWLHNQQRVLKEVVADLPFHRWESRGGEKVCVLTSGVAYGYVKDALWRMRLEDTVAVFKTGSVRPLPESLLKGAMSGRELVLVVEEGEPFLELHAKALASEIPSPPAIRGKFSGDIRWGGELNIDAVAEGLSRVLGDNCTPPSETRTQAKAEALRAIPPRTMAFCSGCPHSATAYALGEVIRKLPFRPVVAGDIGCYVLTAMPPYDLGDVKYSMGASLGVGSGLSRALGEKVVALIGDGTFFHAGIQALINAVYNQAQITVVVLDNATTGMTGGQPHPGTGVTATGREGRAVSLEKLIAGCGVEQIEIVDAYDVRALMAALRRAMEAEGVSVVIARRECAIEAVRHKRGIGARVVPYRVVPEDCTGCEICLKRFSCPSLAKSVGLVEIDPNTCVGCGVCAQICPVGAIRLAE